MTSLNRNVLIFIAAVFAILWLGLLIRARSLDNQLRSLRLYSVTIEALNADSAQPIPTTIPAPKPCSGRYFPAELTQTSLPSSAMHLQFISAKPVTFTVTSPGYTRQTITIDDSTPDRLPVKLTKSPTGSNETQTHP